MKNNPNDLRYAYRMQKLDSGTDRYGNCEVCNKHFDTGYMLVEQRVYYSNIIQAESLSHHKCRTVFGHKNCLATLTECEQSKHLEK
ncbi:hypothetical protein CAG54_00415 [Vibrio sp. V27_P1S3P104]|uniref:hypothetical protein n=1 Tax=Vibrio sp. V27_P1S3P104 TaxID=1938679 RepID=UPI0013723007|nr:hypothetical protein [Vibrio sp. V27_P1S3P104]NAX35988.1 hypothetical protein [Vibrio sp. V27_P1S3P104]